MFIDTFNTNNRTFIVAEIGNNHEGDIEIAKEMIDSAIDCGSDAVKFQTFLAEEYVSQKYTPERYKQLKKFQLSQNDFIELFDYAKKSGVIFISTPFDLESAKFLCNLCPVIKISSSDLTFIPMIIEIAKTNKPIILSTGFHTKSKIESAVQLIAKYRNVNANNLAILHCVGNYHTLPKNANLNTIEYYKSNFQNITIGYSDHTIGTFASEIAVSKGAQIVEKHFTLDKNFSNFHDHKISANPSEMKDLVDKIRLVERYLGSHDKVVNEKERELKKLIDRKIVSKKELKKGDILKIEDISWVRLESGIPSGKESLILNKKLNCNLSKGSIISENHVI